MSMNDMYTGYSSVVNRHSIATLAQMMALSSMPANSSVCNNLAMMKRKNVW